MLCCSQVRLICVREKRADTADTCISSSVNQTEAINKVINIRLQDSLSVFDTFLDLQCETGCVHITKVIQPDPNLDLNAPFLSMLKTATLCSVWTIDIKAHELADWRTYRLYECHVVAVNKLIRKL